MKKNVYAGFSAKITAITLMSLLCMSTFLYADYTGSVITDPQELSFSQIDGYDLVSLNEYFDTDEEGSPQLPVKILKFLIPIDVNLGEVTVNHSEMIELEGMYNIYPAQPPFPTDGSDMPAFVDRECPYFCVILILVNLFYPIFKQDIKLGIDQSPVSNFHSPLFS